MSEFSERMGLIHKKAIQCGSMDTDLRNSLWNVLHKHFWSHVNQSLVGHVPADQLATVLQQLWRGFFKWRVDNMSWQWEEIRAEIDEWYRKAEWNQVYDFIQFMIPLSINTYPTTSLFVADVNSVLEVERSGYRIIGDKVVPISNTEEVNAIESALTSPNMQVARHIRCAVEKLAIKPYPDCRNAIKESISAVEAMARFISGKPKATLGDALPVLKRKIGLPETLETGLSKLYGYTNNDGGIRHALPDGGEEIVEPNMDDARFWLVLCSAMSNYLLSLSQLAR